MKDFTLLATMNASVDKYINCGKNVRVFSHTATRTLTKHTRTLFLTDFSKFISKRKIQYHKI